MIYRRTRVTSVLAAALISALALVSTERPAEAQPAPVAAASSTSTCTTGCAFGTSTVWTHFADPDTPGGPSTTITNEVVRLIENTESDGTIRAAIHSLTISAISNALIDAQNTRGVDVQVVYPANKQGTSAAVSSLKTALGSDMKLCNRGGGACIGTATMHAKFMTFSSTTDPDGQAHDDVSWFGSSNFTGESGTNAFNDAITVYDDPVLATNLNNYFDDLFGPTGAWAGGPVPTNPSNGNVDYYDSTVPRGYLDGSVGAETVYVSPEATYGGGGPLDLIEGRIDDVTPNSECRVRIAMANVNNSRNDLRNTVIDLAEGGCKVWMVVGTCGTSNQYSEMDPSVDSALRAAGVKIRQKSSADIHNKFIMIQGRFDGVLQNRVYTGSENWTGSAVTTNDEIFVKMSPEFPPEATPRSTPLYDDYYRHFGAMYDNASSTATFSSCS